jgi:Site-specific recombinase XerD
LWRGQENNMTRDMTPTEAVERYLKERRPNVSESTLYNISCALNRFIEFCDQEDITQISEIDAFLLSDFKLHRQEQVSEMTVYNNLSALRVFVRWAVSMGLVESGLAEAMILPNPDDTRDTKIEPETAEQILNYLDKFEYATLRHALFALLWDTGFRIGTVRAIDCADYHPDEQYVVINHRPETDTPLKNGSSAEREVNLHNWVCDILADYIQMNQHSVTDEHGREPLLTTRNGRPNTTNLRAHINALTRPCHFTGDCPHNRQQDECEAAQYEYSQRCPSSVSPHPIRRSAITAWLNNGHRKELISDRMDISADTLDKHYDARTEQEKRQLRREQFNME